MLQFTVTSTGKTIVLLIVTLSKSSSHKLSIMPTATTTTSHTDNYAGSSQRNAPTIIQGVANNLSRYYSTKLVIRMSVKNKSTHNTIY
mmetsp:Transcript_33040/g.47814  ORF Transcript_33040/g.47814 Transcript_33040/m.47814 type:complete len:88 (-) Transcript_33040:119-382(-)